MNDFVTGLLAGIAFGLLVMIGALKILEILDRKDEEVESIEADEKKRRNVQG